MEKDRVFTDYIELHNGSNPVKSNCGNMTFYNTGTKVMRVNGWPVQPNDQYYIPANQYEINRTNYVVTFEPGIGDEIFMTSRQIYTDQI